MQYAKATGPRAAALKYDILTALLSLAAHDKGVDGRLAQRLALVITARLSWKTETFCVGIRELGQLWAVTERTAKRELAHMRARDWISVTRAARRGQVTVHRVNIAQVMSATQTCWDAVGPDFAERMGQGGPQPQPDQTVVPFRKPETGAPVLPAGGLWSEVAAYLDQSDPALYRAWLSKLTEVESGAGRLVLAAPSPFIASYVKTHLLDKLGAAAVQVDPSIRAVVID